MAKQISKAHKGPRAFPLSYAHFDQKDIKSYFPVGSYVWRARRTDSWNARYLSFPVHSCKDSTWGGELEAVRECARFCWSWHLAMSGVDEGECPIAGVFSPPTSSGAASSST